MDNVLVADPWQRAGRVAGYGAAVALAPYVLIKASWVLGALAGVLPTGQDLDLPAWVVVNTLTIGMAAAAIAVALTLVRPWGARVPARTFVVASWLGAGFLVPLLPYTLLDLLAGPETDGDMPAWEGVLIQVGFVGMGIGLAVALPAYFLRRWPDAVAGRVGERPVGARVRPPLVAATALTAGWAAWALRGDVLLVILGAWAVAGVTAAWCLTAGRPGRAPRLPFLTLAWLGSGSLFAWSAWKLPLSFVVDGTGPAGAHVAGAAAGVLLLPVLMDREVTR